MNPYSKAQQLAKPGKRDRKPPKGMKRVAMKKCGPRTKKSWGSLFPKLVDRNYRAFIRTQQCVLAGRSRQSVLAFWYPHHCMGRVQACHVKSRGAGGADIGNLYPGCAGAHDEQGRIGVKAFEKRWRVKLEHIAAGYGLKYSETGGRAA